jgi:small subunit ribosomal protein S8
MTMTDPIADMLTRLRNANSAYHDTVGMPYSKIKSHIAEILQQEGYIASWRVEDAEVGKNLVVTLKFGNARERSIAGIKRVSKPGLRVYAKKDNLPKVLGKQVYTSVNITQSTQDRPGCGGTELQHCRSSRPLRADIFNRLLFNIILSSKCPDAGAPVKY